jgi:Cu+-exporting ATPase
MKDHVKDPVCGTDVEKKPEHSETYGTTLYFFCSDKCQGAFKKNPQNYIPQTG